MLNLIGYETEKLNIKGADEIDIVYSALDEIMTGAVKENWDFAIANNLHFRDACLVRAMEKIAQAYKDSGITI